MILSVRLVGVATGRFNDLASVMIPRMSAWRQASLEIDCWFVCERSRAITVSVADTTREDTGLDEVTHFCIACPADVME